MSGVEFPINNLVRIEGRNTLHALERYCFFRTVFRKRKKKK